MSELEVFTLDGLVVNDGTLMLERLSCPPPAKKPAWISGADSEGAILGRVPTHENRVIEMGIRVAQQANHDAVVAHIGSVIDKLEECAQQEYGLPLVWEPAGSTADPITFRCLLGEITELPIDWQDSGRFVNSWMFTVRLTCLPFGEGVEWPASREITLAYDTVPATRIEGYGHSYLGAFGVAVADGFFTKVSDYFGLTGGQSGGGGSSIVDALFGQLTGPLARTTGSPPQTGLVMWGMNDVAAYGPVFGGVKAAYRALISRMRTQVGDAKLHSDGSVAYSAGWTVAGTLRYATAPASFTITLPAAWPGGALCLIAAESQGAGAIYTVTVDGVAAGSWDTRLLFPSAPAAPGVFGAFGQRFPLLPGAASVTVSVASVSSFTFFHAFNLERGTPPLIAAIKQPRPFSYLNNYGASYHVPTDADIAILNTALSEVVAEFTDGYVVLADPDPLIDKRADLFLVDELHPNEAGHALIAKAAQDAMMASGKLSAVGLVTSSDPLVTLELEGVPGDVDALVELEVTDAASQSRRFVAWGMESRWYPTSSPPSQIVDSTSMLTSGYAGVTATQAGAYSGASNNVIGATLRPQVQAVCGLPNLTHVGAFRPQLRFYASDLTVALRLSYQVGDGPLRSLSYKTPVAEGWNTIDLGLITIPEAKSGAQRWTGRIEAYSLDVGGETFRVDVMLLMPAEKFGRAVASNAYAPGTIVGYDEFSTTTAGTVLNGATADSGATWATSGSATDFVAADAPGAADETVVRSTVSDAGPRYGIFGATSYAATEASVVVLDVGPGLLSQMGLVLRWVDASNYLRVVVDATFGTGPRLTVEMVVAGVGTILAEEHLPSVTGVRVRAIAYPSGVVVASVLSSTAVLATASAVASALATGGALASGKPGIFDRNFGLATTRYYDSFSVATPAAEPIVCYSGQSIEFRHDAPALREDATGTYTGPPPEYIGPSSVTIPCAGGPGRKTRIAVMARRNDATTTTDDHIADAITVAVYATPRYLVIPRG